MQSDNHLIRKIKKKQNKEAAGLLIERYYREIYAYTYRQVACKELAMDLTQEIFILVLKGIRAFDEKKGSFRTWIYRIASNKITNYYRSLAYRKSQLEGPYEQEYEHTGVSPDISSQVLRQEVPCRVRSMRLSTSAAGAWWTTSPPMREALRPASRSL